MRKEDYEIWEYRIKQLEHERDELKESAEQERAELTKRLEDMEAAFRVLQNENRELRRQVYKNAG